MTTKDIQACEHAYGIWKDLKSKRADMARLAMQLMVNPEVTDDQILDLHKSMIHTEKAVREMQAAIKSRYQRIAPRYMNFDL
jgi:predicted  nucleic acid-binding Zn-ribbon protein